MKLFDQARAIARLVLFNSERNTISEQAKQATEAARIEREQASRAMNDLLFSLVQRRVTKEMSSQSTNGTHP